MTISSLYQTAVGLADDLERIFDIIFLEVFHPLEDEEGHIEYPISLTTFAVGCDGTEYALDEKNQWVYCWSPGGGFGCLSESLDDFLTLTFNCPQYWDFLNKRFLNDLNKLEQDIKASENKLLMYYPDFAQIREKIMCSFGVKMQSNKASLIRKAIKILESNQLEVSFRENDGSSHRVPTFLEW